MPKEHHFKSREDRAQYAKELYRKLARRLHPDYNPFYDSNEDIRKMFIEASDRYRCNDVAGLEIAEHKTALLFDQLGLDGNAIEAKFLESKAN